VNGGFRGHGAMPRVLVCTVSSWNDRVGGDTYTALFSGYDRNKLANLFIREETPNSSVCTRYFRISESRVIRSVLKRRIATGKELRGADIVPEREDLEAQRDTAARYEKHRRKRSWILLYAREILWRLGRWKTPELDAFLDDFKPDVVLFGMEGYIHFNRINRYIVRRTGARAIGYFYDDNFTYKQRPWNLGYRVYRFFQRRDLKKTARCCSAFFAISPKTKREADEFFGIDSILLTKPVSDNGFGWTPYIPRKPLKMLYTGNLLIGRLATLKLVGDALHAVNGDESRIALHVYTTTDVSTKEAADLDSSIHLHGAVPQGEVVARQKEADVLLFIEDLLGPYRKTARLSFSTKITDYLGSGRCILAIGDRSLASMEYLRDEEAALCACSESEVLEVLQQLTSDPSLVSEYGRRAFECGHRNHDERLVRARLHSVICGVVEGASGVSRSLPS